MRKSLIILLLGIFVAVGCSDELAHRLDRLEDRIEKLEKLCTKMNSNITALQKLVKAIEEGNFVTSVEPLEKDGQVVGYVIKFSKGDSITIYNGKDGQDGQNGADAVAPVITAERHSDGVYYWKLNGRWLLDENGHKLRVNAENGKDGADGQDGQNGQHGSSGEDGTVPLLKIEEGIWYVSVDNGEHWDPVGRADGKDGEDGMSGDTMFTEVDTSNPDYVVFRMSDGTEVKVPTWEAFQKLQTLCTEINSNIEAANTVVSALQSEDYIVSIEPLMTDGKESGYEIVFSKSGKICIHNGKDAAPANTPEIGIAKDADGIYYWTLNGGWMLNSHGEKMRAEGIKGENGQPGNPGKDAVVPQLKIEEGKWYISYNFGGNWELLGNAIGEPGAAGNPMDPFFKEVTYDEANAYFTLSDGTTVTVPFAVESIVGKVLSISFMASQADGRVPMKKAPENQGVAVFDFLIQPQRLAADIAAQWQHLLQMKAFYTLTKVSRFIDLPILSATSTELGILSVKVSGENLDEAFYSGQKAAGAILFLNDGKVEKNSGEVHIYPEI